MGALNGISIAMGIGVINQLADWAAPLLTCIHCKRPLTVDSDQLVCPACGSVGNVEQGVLRFPMSAKDASIGWYQRKGGAHFFERSQVPFTMSSLDAPLYHEYLAGIRSRDTDAVIVDVGAGDGRNTLPWLEWGFQRVIATDAVFASLVRFQERLSVEHPEWLSRVLLIECDARSLPLATDSVDTAFAIESLYYLNEDYSVGLAECHRILKPNARLLVAERSWEGALLTRLFYGGIEGMLSLSQSRDMWDGSADDAVRSRSFTEQEILSILREHGFSPLECRGVPIVALVLGYLRGEGKVNSQDQQLLPQVNALLQHLGSQGHMRRVHVVTARRN